MLLVPYLCITFLNTLPFIFFSLNLENVGECCKAQWVCVDQKKRCKNIIYYYYDDDDDDDD